MPFLENGGKITFDGGRWVGHLGHQVVFLDRVVDRDIHVLDVLEFLEFAGWKIGINELGHIVLEYNLRQLLFDSYESIVNIQECFIEDECLDVKGKTVIDIGAYKGESALYFWARGAKNILALEPFSDFYEQALKNVRKNNLQNEVKVLNCGVGETVHSFEANPGGVGGSLISLSDLERLIVENESPCSEIVLKIDCGGCEYGLYRFKSRFGLERSWD